MKFMEETGNDKERTGKGMERNRRRNWNWEHF